MYYLSCISGWVSIRRSSGNSLDSFVWWTVRSTPRHPAFETLWNGGWKDQICHGTAEFIRWKARLLPGLAWWRQPLLQMSSKFGRQEEFGVILWDSVEEIQVSLWYDARFKRYNKTQWPILAESGLRVSVHPLLLLLCMTEHWSSLRWCLFLTYESWLSHCYGQILLIIFKNIIEGKSEFFLLFRVCL